MVRPTKYTPLVVDRIIEGLRIGLTDQDAAIYGGVSPDTFSNYQKRYSSFSDRVREAKAQRTALWLNNLRSAGKLDWRATADLLDRCAPDYRKSANVDIKHSGTVKHNVTLSADDRAIAERMAFTRGLPVEDVIAEAEAILSGTS